MFGGKGPIYRHQRLIGCAFPWMNEWSPLWSAVGMSKLNQQRTKEVLTPPLIMVRKAEFLHHRFVGSHIAHRIPRFVLFVHARFERLWKNVWCTTRKLWFRLGLLESWRIRSLAFSAHSLYPCVLHISFEVSYPPLHSKPQCIPTLMCFGLGTPYDIIATDLTLAVCIVIPFALC